MSEQPSERPSTDLNWCEGGTPNQVTEPSAKRAAGWYEGSAPGAGDADKHPAGFENWLNREHGRHFDHLEAISPRQFEDLVDLWDVTEVPAVGDLVRIVPPSGTLRGRVAPYWSQTTTATGGGIIGTPCTDNERIYYRSGTLTQSVVAASLADGSELWEQTPGNTIRGLCCDGAYIYWSRQSVSGLEQRVKSTGASSASGGTTAGADALASNGAYVVGVEGSGGGGAGVVTFWQVSAASVTQTGTVSTGSAALAASAIDDVQCYVGGTRSGTTDLWAYTLSTRASAWTAQLSTAAAPTVNSICTDGDVVYVGTDRVATASGFANVFAVERLTGRVMWELDVGATVNVDHVEVDDRYLYVVTDAFGLFVFKLRHAAPIPPLILTGPGTWNDICVDGISVIGGDGSSPNEDLRRAWIGGASRLFQRVAGNDVERRPFFTQNIPIDGRV